jgi:nucleotide-binding universal stress UspA family protein
MTATSLQVGEVAMNIKSILFPTDFSQHTEAALKYASALAAESGATLHIVYVHDVRQISAAMGEPSALYAVAWDDELRQARERLNRTLPTAATVNYTQHCLTGIPDAELAQYAADHKIDLIVMSSHGRSGLSRLLMGSVAEAVMRKAPCPVLIVRQPNDTGEQVKNLFNPRQETRLLT